MKTSTKWIGGALALALVTIAIAYSSVLAFQGNTQRNTKPFLEKTVLQPSENLPALSETEKALLLYGQQEERLARDVYLALSEQYGTKVLSNIASSENRHLEEIGTLLDAYNIPQTQGYGDLQSVYTDLIAKGKMSLKDALEVGITIELLDIKDIDASLLKTTNEAIKAVYGNLRAGSVNHLNAYVRNLQQNGFDTDLNWQAYTSQDALDENGGGKGREGSKGKGNGGGKGSGLGHGNTSGL